MSGQDFCLQLCEYQILDNRGMLLLWVHLSFLSTCALQAEVGLLAIIQAESVIERKGENMSVKISIVQRHKHSTLVLSFPNSGYCILLLFGLPFKPASTSCRGRGFLEVSLLEMSTQQ